MFSSQLSPRDEYKLITRILRTMKRGILITERNRFPIHKKKKLLTSFGTKTRETEKYKRNTGYVTKEP